MRLRLIFSIVALGVALGFSARIVKSLVFPEPARFDASTQLLNEAPPQLESR